MTVFKYKNKKLVKVAGKYSMSARQAFLLAHPIGSYYISEDPTSPAELYGGSWERVVGRTLIGSAPDDGTDYSSFLTRSSSGYWYYADGAGNRYSMAVGTESGTPNVALTESEMPAHYHRLASNTVSGSSTVISVQSVYAGKDDYASQFITGNAGSGKAHNNLPPYRATNIWYRYN